MNLKARKDIDKEIRVAKIFFVLFYILSFALLGLLAFSIDIDVLRDVFFNFALFVFCLAFFVMVCCYLLYLKLLKIIREKVEDDGSDS